MGGAERGGGVGPTVLIFSQILKHKMTVWGTVPLVRVVLLVAECRVGRDRDGYVEMMTQMRTTGHSLGLALDGHLGVLSSAAPPLR